MSVFADAVAGGLVNGIDLAALIQSGGAGILCFCLKQLFDLSRAVEDLRRELSDIKDKIK